MKTVKVARFDLYPATNPDSYVVGFAFEANGNRGYLEAIIPLDETINQTVDDIVKYALVKEIEVEDEPNTCLSEIINERLSYFLSKAPVVGSQIELPVQK